MEINAKTQIACLIGHPVSHSFSPYIHNYLAQKYGLNLKYMAFDVDPDRVGEAVKGIGALGFVGSNVTIPHKVDVMKYLDKVDPHAKLIGAVNTIKNENGTLTGYNTDGAGFVKSLLQEGHKVKGKHAMLLGAGGACRAIAVELAANGIGRITIRNHTLSKAEALAEDIKGEFDKVRVNAGPLELTDGELQGVDFLINTTPLGMGAKKEMCPIEKQIKPPAHLVACDIVYTPYDTQFLLWAKKNKLAVVYGTGMLIHQALQSFYIWTGIDVSNAYQEVFNLLSEKKVIG